MKPTKKEIKQLQLLINKIDDIRNEIDDFIMFEKFGQNYEIGGFKDENDPCFNLDVANGDLEEAKKYIQGAIDGETFHETFKKSVKQEKEQADSAALLGASKE